MLCRRHRRFRFNFWVGKIPWRRKWQCSLVFLPGEAYGQRGVAGYRPRGYKESDTMEHSHTIGHLYFFLYPLWMLFVHVSVGVLVFYLWFVRSLSNYQGCFRHQHYNLLFAYMFRLRVVSVKVVFHKSNLSVLAFVISHSPTAFKFRMSFPIWWISISIFS